MKKSSRMKSLGSGSDEYCVVVSHLKNTIFRSGGKRRIVVVDVDMDVDACEQCG